MAYVIKLELKEDLEWLESILANSVKKLRQGSSERLQAASANIARVHEAVLVATEVRERSTQEDKKEEKIKDDYVPNLCVEHPKYEAKRPPRTGCEGCWDAYKRLHPESYDLNRRKFDQRQRVAEAN